MSKKPTYMKVCIKDLTFDTIIGILDFERQNPQKVVINCTFVYKHKDDFFINYAEVANDIRTLMIQKEFKLLEDAIVYIKKYLQKKYRLKKLKLKISKPDILKDCIVEVIN